MNIKKLLGTTFLVLGVFAFGAQTRSVSANIGEGDDTSGGGGCNLHSVCEINYHDGDSAMCGYFPFGDQGCGGYYSVDCHEEC